MSEENEYSIRQVLMYRDGLSEEEAEELIAEAREELNEGRDPEEISAIITNGEIQNSYLNA